MLPLFGGQLSMPRGPNQFLRQSIPQLLDSRDSNRELRIRGELRCPSEHFRFPSQGWQQPALGTLFCRQQTLNSFLEMMAMKVFRPMLFRDPERSSELKHPITKSKF